MSTSVHDVIEAFRRAPSNRERGAKFEQLMVRYLQLDPLFSEKYSNVWMWQDWPGRVGKTDTGIDLVAQDRATGQYTAIQCKFYEPTHTLSKGDIDSFFTASGKAPFANRIIISTTDKWSQHAEDACAEQQIPVQRIGLSDIAAAPIDWEIAWPDDQLVIAIAPAAKHEPRPHQRQAIEKVFDGFEAHDRGKLIMACGTGKTFTALKIAEYTAREKGEPTAVLFLVPSISLLSQTLREWSAQSQTTMRAFAVCSDTKVGKRANAGEDISVHDLALPATTDPHTLITQVAKTDASAPLAVVFSTYQSIAVISEAQKLGLPDFDLIICDEAHRTTGVTLADADESNFVKVHDQDFIAGSKRLYMTATPRLFAEETKVKATENDALLASMDDESLYGPEFHRLGFGEAVNRGLLTDYKVLVLTVDEKYIAGPLQQQLADDNHELSLDDATKIVGCWNGLAKRTGHGIEGTDFGRDTRPMQRAVAFLRDIKTSVKFADKFAAVLHAYDEADEDVLNCEVHHVDGKFNALQRNHELDWLKAPIPAAECRILSNARCLSEGVDVPALDAVLFLNPRNSVVDVVQSVGRVMRKAEGKEYGYILLPVGIPAGLSPSEALADNKRFKVVWQVLQALRAHDDRFNAMVNKLDLNKRKAAESILVGHVTGDTGEDFTHETAPASKAAEADVPIDESSQVAEQLALFQLDEWRDAIFAKIVDKVGTRTYWEDWAKDVADIARAQETRIRALLHGANAAITAEFDKFVKALQGNLNDSINESHAIEMLCQHLITKPVFEALFEGYDFAGHNPVSKVMQAMVDTLHDQSLEAETERLEEFYASVRLRAEGIDNAEGKQRIVAELYEKFFRIGFKKTSDSLGIVYTPIQIVDFILRAANDALVAEFDKSLSDDGVHVLDPFTGTGTFIVRLLQSGLVKSADLLRKYTAELHANEIMLLAYYIAAINIEATFHDLYGGTYRPFEGIVLTDTFQIAEEDDTMDAELFPQNNERIVLQQNSPIRVIVGNPPYSVGQVSANDDNANITYPTLDNRIRSTYLKSRGRGGSNSLFDSYIRAIRWATDRIGDHGIVAYVSNGGWIDGNTADGLRRSLADEFTTIYVYNLRGNTRTTGEQVRREGGQTFGPGSRATIAIFIAIKNLVKSGPCEIRYRDIGDYLTREEKLAIVGEGTLSTVDWEYVTPNPDGDWINQRNTAFGEFPPMGEKHSDVAVAIFNSYSRGLESGRDAWVYNFSLKRLKRNCQDTLEYYSGISDEYATWLRRSGLTRKKESRDVFFREKSTIVNDTRRISWTLSLKNRLISGKPVQFSPENITCSTYRPFCKQYSYFDRTLNHIVGLLPSMFPTSAHKNMGILLTAPASHFEFTPLMVDSLPNLHLLDTGQFFPRWTYEKVESDEGQLNFGATDDGEYRGYRRVDNISNAILADYRAAFGRDVSKDDIFYYVYGVLYSPQYRAEFAADLKKMLPRIRPASSADEFRCVAEAGRALADLHIGYEQADPYPLEEIVSGGRGLDERGLYRVSKMRFKSKTDKSILIYNGYVTLAGIPERAHQYMLGPRSALEWLIDRYQVKTDKASGILNDPNDWCDAHGDARYIVDLVKRIVTVSVETMRIVDGLRWF